jgi:hypothetical protein
MGVKEDLADLASVFLIFGTHVHVGIEDKDFLIDAMNVARYFIPHVLCLSTSSPFWMGRITGPQILPQYHLSELPADRHPADAAGLDRLRAAAGYPGAHRVRSQRIQDLVGRAAQPQLPHHRVPLLRRLHPGGRGA